MEENRRQTSSMLDNCSFKIYGNFLMESGDLLSKYQIITILLLHLRLNQCIDVWMWPNLNQSLLWLELAQGLIEYFHHFCNKTQILQLLQKIISNAKTKRRTEYLSGQSPIQALLQSLQDSDWRYIAMKWMLRSTSMPFFAHPNSVQLATTYNAVLVMDCTYKTYWFHMKLFDVVGITGFNTTIYVGFAFLQK